jgi:hypothetical protein
MDKKQSKSVKLFHHPLNTDFVNFKNIVIKLSYYIASNESPSLEVFINTEQSQKEEWSHYGPKEGKYKTIQFERLHDKQTVEIDHHTYQISFHHTGKEPYTYPKGTENANYFEFLIEEVKT